MSNNQHRLLNNARSYLLSTTFQFFPDFFTPLHFLPFTHVVFSVITHPSPFPFPLPTPLTPYLFLNNLSPSQETLSSLESYQMENGMCLNGARKKLVPGMGPGACPRYCSPTPCCCCCYSSCCYIAFLRGTPAML